MKNIYDVLRQKEAEIQELQKDIEALRIAARLLADESDSDTSVKPVPAARPAAVAVPRDGLRQFP